MNCLDSGIIYDEISYKVVLLGKLKEKYNDKNLALAIISNLHSEKKYKIMSEYLEIEQNLNHDDIMIVSVVLSKSKVRNAKELFAEMQKYI